MRISPQQLEAFSAVMTVGTATAAASVLHTSQPAITRSLRQLEDATGLVLFTLVRGRLQPTDEAHEFMRVVRDNFHGMSRIRQAAEDIRLRKAGHLRIGCLPAFSQGLLARAASEFLVQHPDVNISLYPLLSAELAQAMSTHRIDVGVAAYEVGGPAFKSYRFTAVNEVVLFPKGHPLTSKTVIGPDDFPGERVIRLVESDPYRQRFDQVLTESGIFLNNIVEAETSAGVCALVAQGIGIALLNPLTALDFKEQLVLRRFSHELPFVTTFLRPLKTSKARLISAFEQALVRQRDKDIKAAEELCRKKYA